MGKVLAFGAQGVLLMVSGFIMLGLAVRLGDAPFLDTLEHQCQDHLGAGQKLADADWSWFPLGLRCVATSSRTGISVVREPSWPASLLLLAAFGLAIWGLTNLFAAVRLAVRS